MHPIDATPAAPAPVNHLERLRANERIHEQLYRLTQPPARIAFLARLGREEPPPPSREWPALRQRLARWLGQEGPQEALSPNPDGMPELEPDERAALQAQLQAVPATAPSREQVDQRVADELAAEFARALWSSLVDAAQRAPLDRPLQAQDWLPAWPDTPGRRAPLHDRLIQSLGHYGLCLEQMVSVALQAAKAWLHEAPAQAKALALPHGLQVDAQDLAAFLSAQDALRHARSKSLGSPPPPPGAPPAPRRQLAPAEGAKRRLGVLAASAASAKRRPGSR